MIEIPEYKVPTWHSPPRRGYGKLCVECPVAVSIPKINLNASLLEPKHDEIQFAIPVDIGQLGCYIPVLALHNHFSESALAIAEEGLDLTKMAGPHEVGEAIMIDVASSQSGIANISPRGCSQGESVAIALPEVERRVPEPSGRYEI